MAISIDKTVNIEYGENRLNKIGGIEWHLCCINKTW